MDWSVCGSVLIGTSSLSLDHSYLLLALDNINTAFASCGTIQCLFKIQLSIQNHRRASQGCAPCKPLCIACHLSCLHKFHGQSQVASSVVGEDAVPEKEGCIKVEVRLWIAAPQMIRCRQLIIAYWVAARA